MKAANVVVGIVLLALALHLYSLTIRTPREITSLKKEERLSPPPPGFDRFGDIDPSHPRWKGVTP